MAREFIQYRFTLTDDSQEIFNIELDSATLSLLAPLPARKPSWTKLEFHQCPHCPLKPETDPFWPLAVSLVNIVNRFDGWLSYDKVHLDVLTDERSISEDTTVQRGIGSLMGLVIATSGCPHTAFFKPMAKFHLPLASTEETIYRATSMYLLAQYFMKREGQSAELELDGLQVIYRNMQTVNAAILGRLRSATETDSSVNAVIVLDIYAKTVEVLIEKSLKSIRHLFDSYFKDTGSTPEEPAKS
jgi:hypothetical protein